MLANQTIQAITEAAHTIIKNAPYLSGIATKGDYYEALTLMDVLVDDYDNNIVLIEALGNVITRYEQSNRSFDAFNGGIEGIDPAVATFRTIIDQHGLRQSDFEYEVGKQGYVCLILAGKRKLNRDHITKLADRFNVSQSLFA